MILNSIKKGFNSVKKAVGIQTPEEKKLQLEIKKAADSLKEKYQPGKDGFFTRNNFNNELEFVPVSPKEIAEIENQNAKTLKKARVPDIENPNFDRHNLERYKDGWNRYR